MLEGPKVRFCFIAPGDRTVDVLRGDTTKSGGAEAQVAYLASALASRGHQVELIYGYGSTKAASCVIAGVKCIDAYPAWKHPGSLLAFWGTLKESAADLIYIRLPGDFLWVLGLYSKLYPRSRFLCALANDRNCNPWQYYTYNKWFHGPLYALGMRSADIIAVQHEAQGQLVKPYVKARPVVIPNLVRSFKEEPRRYEETNTDAIWIAQIRPQKQLDLFLDVVEALPHLKFAVVGWFALSFDQKACQDLERRMQALENVCFLGAQHFEDVLQLLERSKILVNTSNWEGFPNTMLEAWSVGVPVVSLQIDPGGIIRRDNIGLVSGTVSKMVSDVERLVQTRSLNREMGERGLEYVRRTHSLEAVCRAFGRIMPGTQAQDGAVRCARETYHNMRYWSFLRMPSVWRVGLILLAIMASLVAGASPFVLASPLSPLIVGGAAVATALGIILLQNPVWALYVVTFIHLLPRGLIPGNLYSILANLVLLLALLSWLLKTGFHRQRIVWTSTGLLMIVFWVWSFFTLSWAHNLALGRQALVRYTINFLLLLLTVNQVNSLQPLDGLMSTLALNGWILVLFGIGTLLLQGYQAGARLEVLEMNQNLFGVLLVFAMPGVLWHATRSSERQRTSRMSLGFLFISLTLILIAFSGSRGSALSALTTLLAFGLWKPTRSWGKVGLLILAVAVISAPFIFSTIIDRFSGELGTLGGRTAIWEATWLVIQEHPWHGVGIGNARESVLPYLAMFASTRERESRSIHNPLLETWSNVGLPGLLMYLGILGSAMWSFVRQYCRCRKTGRRSLELYFALISCTFAGYMLSWIKGGGMGNHPTYFLLLALLLIPSRLDIDGVDCTTKHQTQHVGTSKL